MMKCESTLRHIVVVWIIDRPQSESTWKLGYMWGHQQPSENDENDNKEEKERGRKREKWKTELMESSCRGGRTTTVLK